MAAVDVPQNATGQTVRRFDVARETIRSYIQGMAGQDEVAIVSLAPQPELLVSGNGEQKSALLAILDNLVPGATGVNLTAALSLASGLVDPELQHRIVVLTDGNYSIEAQPLPAMLSSVTWQFIPDAAADNQALLNVSARRLPDGRHRIFARVANFSNTPALRTLQFWAGETVLDEALIEVGPQADAVRLWTAPTSIEQVAVQIVEADALPLDNRAVLLLLNDVQRRVLLVSETPDLLTKALEVQPGVELTTVATAGLAGLNLADFDLVVFDGLPVELTSWPPGNLLVVNPPLGHPLLPSENLARNLRPDPGTASSLLAGIDLSGVYFSRAPRIVVPDWAEVDLVGVENEQSVPLIFQGIANNGRVMVWAFDLAASNLPARLALPLLTANSFSALLAPSLSPAIAVGEPVLLNRNFYVETPEGQRLFPDSNQIAEHLFSRTKMPGLYQIYNEANNLVAGFAVHAGSPLESNLGQRQWQPEELKALETGPLPLPEAEINYEDFWPWLAGLALGVIMVEGWLAWRR
jgi:hypothetical protein